MVSAAAPDRKQSPMTSLADHRTARVCAAIAAAVTAVAAVTVAAGDAAAAATITVAADGSGTYRTIQEAVAAAGAGTVITVKAGTYQGQVLIPSTKPDITLQGATGTSSDVVVTGN